MTDSEKLRALATWFDIHDAMKGKQLFDNEVQIDLRAMADRIEQLNKHGISGKRPTVEDFFRQSYPESTKWDKFDFELIRFDALSLMDFAERYARLAACASGAVDKTVCVWCGIKECKTNGGTQNCIGDGCQWKK